MGGPPSRRGHALAELVMALPILAVAGTAASGMVVLAAGMLLEGERRLHAAMGGTAVLDSLRVDAARHGTDGPESGALDLPGEPGRWEWNGGGELILDIAPEPGEGVGPLWRLRVWGEGLP